MCFLLLRNTCYWYGTRWKLAKKWEHGGKMFKIVGNKETKSKGIEDGGN